MRHGTHGLSAGLAAAVLAAGCVRPPASPFVEPYGDAAGLPIVAWVAPPTAPGTGLSRRSRPPAAGAVSGQPHRHSEDPPAPHDRWVRVTVWPAGTMSLEDARDLGQRVWAQVAEDLRTSGQHTWSGWDLDGIRVDTSPPDGPHVHLVWTAVRAIDNTATRHRTTWPTHWPTGGTP